MQVLESGTEFGGYRIEGLLGRGGMSEVYRASNPRLGNTIAVKLLTRELGNDEVFRERFVRESQLAASLNHPNVIPIFDAGEADGLPYIAMRYVEGSDLQELLSREGALPVEIAVSIVSQIGAALDCAHEKGLIHRDVKPANILIENNGNAAPHVYLSDFGVAKHGTSRSGLTSTGQFVGTVDYIAPEQIEGKALSGATDVYSLACVLYQTLTGTPPFDRDTDVGMIYAHLVEPPPPLSERRPDLPAELDAVLVKALSKRPEDRYQSCRAFVADARRAVGLEPGGATVVGDVGAGAAATRLAPTVPPTTVSPTPVASPAPTAVPETILASDGTPVQGTVLAGDGSTLAPSRSAMQAPAAPPTALAEPADSAPPRTPPSEKTTVLMRRFWRSKRLLAAMAAVLLIGGAAAAAAATLGGGSSSNHRTDTDRRRNTSSNSSVSGGGTNVPGDRRRGQKNSTTTTGKKNGSKTNKATQSKSSKQTKKNASNRRRGTSGTTTTSTGSRRRGYTATTSQTSTTSNRRRGATTSGSSGTTTTSDRRRGTTASTSSGSSSGDRRR